MAVPAAARSPQRARLTRIRAAVALTLFTLGAHQALGYAMQRSMLFAAPPPPARSAAQDRADVQVMWLGPDAAVEAWYLPPGGASAAAPGLLYTHGNGELIDDWLEPLQEVRAWGVGVMLVEYPGYGRSRGTASQDSIARIMREAYDALAAQPGIDPARIVAHGRSLGGGAACALALERPLAALVLESSFTSVPALALRRGFLGFLVRDPFDNGRAVERFARPVLILHGAADGMVPVGHARELAARARSAELHVLACGHNDCAVPWETVRAFLTRHSLLP
jgi:uncharacterized protein